MPNTNISQKIILVIDDDPLLIELYRRMFANKGLHPLIASDGEEGLRMIKKEKPDFVILDIRMPKLDGIEVLKKVRGDTKVKDTPVLILTNYDKREYREAVDTLDAVDFITKVGIDPQALVQRVVDFLQNKNGK